MKNPETPKIETTHTVYRLKVEEFKTGPFEELPKHITEENDDDVLLASLKKNLITVTGKEPQCMDGAIINVGALEQLLEDFGLVAFCDSFIEDDEPEKFNQLISRVKSLDDDQRIIYPDYEDGDSDQEEKEAA
jgi:hypothetical protein